MKISLIGGAGFIGLNLCKALVSQGHFVNVFGRPESLKSLKLCPRQKEGQVDWFAGDFLNPADVAAAMQNCEVVFHLVSTTIPQTSNENPCADVNENVISSLRLMEEAKKLGVRRIIFISSGGTVYGRPRKIPIDENHPTDPICSYGITKLMIEKYLALYRELYDLDYIILRLSNPFGEHQRTIASQGAIAVFLGKVLRNECIEIWGNGAVTRDYIYIGDVIKAMLAAIEYNGKERIFNIGSGQGKTLLEILATIENMVGHQVECRFMPGRSFDVPANVLDINKAKAELRWSPKTTLHDGIVQMFHWLKTQ